MSNRRWDIKRTIAGTQERRNSRRNRRCEYGCHDTGVFGVEQDVCADCYAGYRRRLRGMADRRVAERRKS